MSDFSMFAGDVKLITVTVLDDAGDVADITGASIQWKAARSVDDEPVIAKSTAVSPGGIAITDGPAGEFVVTLTGPDTEDLSGLYYHEAEMVLSAAASTVLTGQFVVTKTLIRLD